MLIFDRVTEGQSWTFLRFFEPKLIFIAKRKPRTKKSQETFFVLNDPKNLKKNFPGRKIKIFLICLKKFV